MSTETIDTSTVEHIIQALSEPPAPAAEVVTLGRQMAERILSWLEDHPAIAGIALSTCEEVSVLRQALAEPKVELWAIHSVGPGEVYPCLSKEHAEREAKELFEQGEKMKADRIARGESVEHWHDWVTNVTPSPWEPAEHFEILAEETADHRNDLIARLEELEAKAEPQKSCKWTRDEDTGAYETACGATWHLFDGGEPEEHGQYFCHHCGKQIDD
ncbi:hypothetical protein ACYCFL_05845 [Stutzerimonas nitrititolerans]|uniref:hypothetical protein n=1 Tax=Stutzerimonas nitrititolerans TaxID=2482751 RepID=UPI00289E2C28|nr:hypothetical protein [Stutzerimonas nitrititolerans]